MPSGEKAVNVFVSDAGEGRIEVINLIGGNFVEHGRQLMGNLFAS
jgi:hypothetical protein